LKFVRCRERQKLLTRGGSRMNVSLTPELEQFVNVKVRSGLYHSASEVIREGLRLLKQKDEVHQTKLEDLRREIEIGIDQDDKGQVSRFTKDTLKDIKALARKRLAADRKSNGR
jgi:antitoxin ParD1/3/4